MSKSKLEYIWLDCHKPTQNMRSKTKVVEGFDGTVEGCPLWAFDGSSTVSHFWANRVLTPSSAVHPRSCHPAVQSLSTPRPHPIQGPHPIHVHTSSMFTSRHTPSLPTCSHICIWIHIPIHVWLPARVWGCLDLRCILTLSWPLAPRWYVMMRLVVLQTQRYNCLVRCLVFTFWNQNIPHNSLQCQDWNHHDKINVTLI